jgi:hypothetical protein
LWAQYSTIDESTVPEEIEKDEHDYAPILKRYLETRYSIKINKISRANLKSLKSEFELHGLN